MMVQYHFGAACTRRSWVYGQEIVAHAFSFHP